MCMTKEIIMLMLFNRMDELDVIQDHRGHVYVINGVRFVKNGRDARQIPPVLYVKCMDRQCAAKAKIQEGVARIYVSITITIFAILRYTSTQVHFLD